MLGIGDYQFFFADRAGKIFGQVPNVNLARLTWERDDFGTVLLFLGLPSAMDCDMFDELHTIRHELVVVRNGDVVWEGPITRIGFYSDRVEIDARDVSWYLTRRVNEGKWDHTGTSVNYLYELQGLLQQHYPPVNDPYRIGEHLQTISSAADPKTASVLQPYRQTLYDVLQNASDRGGVDYVVRGRRIILYGHKTRIGQTVKLTPEHFSEQPEVVEYGSRVATRAFTVLENGKLATASAPQEWIDYYGFIDIANTNTDEGEADSNQAISEISANTVNNGYPAPIEVRIPDGATVQTSAPVTFEELMPGMWLPVEAQVRCRPITRLLLVDRLQTIWNAGNETVQITTSQVPATYEDAS